jgi:hypothetical protein
MRPTRSARAWPIRFAEQAAPGSMRCSSGAALQQTAAGLDAADRGNPAATRYFADAKRIAAQAAAVQTIRPPASAGRSRSRTACRYVRRRCAESDCGYGETVTVRLARRPSGVRVRSSTAPVTATGPS